MSGFKALNVESESEDEIDDTKEIQLEEAFKLYQNALKLHSQGPASYEEAGEAYEELFRSEVFKYPEVVSEFAQDEVEEEEPPAAVNTAAVEPEPDAAAIVPTNAADSAASSIPQLVYLSYKNKGQFAVDNAQYSVPSTSTTRTDFIRHYSKSCKSGLTDFAEALERDDTDIDLWKKAARVAEVLSTQRITRFCLESVLAGDDDGFDQTIDLSGLDEAFAAGELDQVIKLLQDDLSKSKASDIRPKQHLLALLSNSNDPYPALPKRGSVLEYTDQSSRPNAFTIERTAMTSDSMAGLGRELLQMVQNHQEGTNSVSAQTLISVADANMLHSPGEAEREVFVDAEEQMQGLEEVAKASNGITADSVDVEHIVATQSPQTMAQDDNETTVDAEHVSLDPTAAPTEPSSTVALPTRKRSSTVAGNEEDGRVRSKRIRARESTIIDAVVQEDEVAPEVTHFQTWHWQVLQDADQHMLKTVNHFLERLGVVQFEASKVIRDYWTSSLEDASAVPSQQLLWSDLGNSVRSWTDDYSQAMLHGHGSQEYVEKAAGLTLFMQHSKPSAEIEVTDSAIDEEGILASFASAVNDSSTTLYDAVFSWFLSLLSCEHDSTGTSQKSLYIAQVWSDDLKQTIVQLLLKSEDQLRSILGQHYDALSQQSSGVPDHELDNEAVGWAARLTELVQTIFELHLDIHSRINNPSSQVDFETRRAQSDSLERWASFADDFMRLYGSLNVKGSATDDLVVRFLWSSTIYAGNADHVEQSHIISCLEDLKRILNKLEVTPLTLPNNAAMPQISVDAAEQEVFRLSTLDFFMSVFDTDNSDPFAVIEKLEPVLEYDRHKQQPANEAAPSARSNEMEELLRFLDSGDASLKLFLWRRLQNAYIAVSYVPKVVSCQLRSLEIIYEELCSSRHAQLEETARRTSMLQWLKDADELLVRLLSKGLSEPNALECLDDTHLQSSLTAVSSLLRLLHGFALYEDNVRFSKESPPHFKGAASTRLFDKCRDRLREMQVRLWSLQYHLFKEGAAQNRDKFPDMFNDLADYLCTTHHALGQRHYCKHANKQFVRLVKNELNVLETTNNYSDDKAQVLYDLYQLKFAVGRGDFDHGCPTENLDKKTAMSIIPLVMAYAKNVNIKDLIKGELRNTIDKVQTASGTAKSPPAALHNKRQMNNWLKRPIIPEDLYRAVKGVGDLATKSVPGETSVKASYGWLFLLGHMTLAKYRSVKRVSPTPTDDLDLAATYLRQDLEYDMEKWETWFRLAQIYEAKIEDDLIWNSTKLNDARGDIAQLERNSIHAFTMAIAAAIRTADDSDDTTQKLSELFQEFAMRLYASSRAPLDMEAFRTDKDMRHMSHYQTMAMSKQPWYQPMSKYAVWSFAAYLLRRKFTQRPKPWLSHYTLGKCLWKMVQSPENDRVRRPDKPEEVLAAFVEAVEVAPYKERSSEPVLEPHFKLVSTVHKMVHKKMISPHQGQQWLRHTRFAQNAHLAEDEDGPEWEQYILDILKKLSVADKQNWHHRIIARSAHVIYDGERNVAGALGAKHEFTQQVFTKTMTYQVWKPEYERPGRHYVYTGRYVLFFAHLLDQLKDRANLDQLVRRVRRKQTDFIDHPAIWESLTTTYVRLLRQVGKIPEGKERAVFDPISFEDFTRNSEKLEKWAHEEETTSVVLDIMRDAIDLKKLNNSLAKGGLIDDLIGDAYGSMYEAFVAQLPPEQTVPAMPPPLPQGTFINMTSEQVPLPAQSEQQTALQPASNEPGQEAAAGPIGLGVQASTPTHQFMSAPTQTQVDPARPPERAKPGRAKTVTRREVQKKAEQALVKPPPIKTPVLSKRPVIEIPVATSLSPVPVRDGYQAMTDARLDRLREHDDEESRATSRRGSMDAGDDADVEDDLSDVDEGEEGGSKPSVKKALFPNLMKHQADEGQQSDADDDLDEDEQEDGAEADIGDEDGGEEEEGDVEDEDEDGANDDEQQDAMDVDEEAGEVEIPESQEARSSQTAPDEAQ